MVVALKPIHDAARIKRVVVSTYQSVSGAGRMAMEELSQQVAALFNGRELKKEKFPHQIAFNCIPHIDVFMDDGYTKEEWKMIQETRKILGEPNLPVTATTVRVPVFLSHSESVNVETLVKLSAAETKRILREAPGVIVADEPENNVYPTPIDASGKDATYVGRIREDDRSPMVSISGSCRTTCAKAPRSTPCRSPRFWFAIFCKPRGLRSWHRLCEHQDYYRVRRYPLSRLASPTQR